RADGVRARGHLRGRRLLARRVRAGAWPRCRARRRLLSVHRRRFREAAARRFRDAQSLVGFARAREVVRLATSARTPAETGTAGSLLSRSVRAPPPWQP